MLSTYVCGEAWHLETLAPDTLPDREPPISPDGTAPLAVITAPLAEPVGVRTEPLAIPVQPRPALSFDVYTPDDTLRGKPAVHVGDSGEARRRRIALGVFGFAVALLTTLAGIGSCEESAPSSHVETTSASITATSATAPTAPAAPITSLAPLEPPPPIATVAPLPQPAPARRPGRRPKH